VPTTNSETEKNNNEGKEIQLNEYREQAREIYIEVMSLYPECPEAWIKAGILEAKSENTKIAQQYFEKARDLMLDDDYRIYFNLGNLCLKNQDFKEAIDLFDKALIIAPGKLKVHKNYIIALSKLEEWDKMEEKCRVILKLDKTNPLALAFLSRALKEKEKFGDLEHLLVKLNKKLENYENKIKENKDFNKQEISKTLHRLKKKIKTKAKDAKKSKFFNQPEDNNIRNEVMNNLETMEQGVKVRTSLNTNTKRKEERSYSVLGAPGGLKNYLQRDPNELETIFSNDPDNREALFALALVYYKRQEFSNSEDRLNKLILLDSFFKKKEVNEKMGDIFFSYKKDFNLALKYYQEACNNEQSPYIYIKIAMCHEKNNNLELALVEFQKTVEISPTLLLGYFHLGCVNSKLKNKAEALNYFKKAYEINKDNTEVIAKYAEELITSSEA
jgi:tetratricopeptide (TPR) repeat protein